MIILVDQDQTIADFEGRFLQLWRRRYPERPFIPLKERQGLPLVYDYSRRWRRDVDAILLERGFFLKLEPIPGMRKALLEMRAAGHEVFICTSPKRGSAHCVEEKYFWLKKHLGLYFAERMITARDKTLVRGNVLVDDWPKITGAMRPVWRHVLFDFPYNRHLKRHPRLERWRDWKKVLLKGGGQ